MGLRFHFWAPFSSGSASALGRPPFKRHFLVAPSWYYVFQLPIIVVKELPPWTPVGSQDKASQEWQGVNSLTGLEGWAWAPHHCGRERRALWSARLGHVTQRKVRPHLQVMGWEWTCPLRGNWAYPWRGWTVSDSDSECGFPRTDS